MSFPDVPKISRKAVDRAGAVIALGGEPDDAEYRHAIDIANAWRVCHAYPLNTFVGTLRKKIGSGKYNEAIIAQRLKRMPAIEFKLRRFPGMKLTQMQDIGGVRAILQNVPDVRRLQADYLTPGRFPHELLNVYDYITQPKIDGYRGVHLAYKYNNTLDRSGKALRYKDLRIELQIRTTLQHQWATAVEMVGTMKGEALKSMQGNTDWRKFFQYVSSVFAIAEDMPVLAAHEHMSVREIIDTTSQRAGDINAIAAIQGWSAAINLVNNRSVSQNHYYFIIRLASVEHKVYVEGFPKTHLAQASLRYSMLEKEYANDISNDVVMVSAGKLRSLKTAYPNYFLDTREFISRLEAIIHTSYGSNNA